MPCRRSGEGKPPGRWPLAAASLALLLLPASPGTAQAQELLPRAAAEERLADSALMARRVGEACIFGAAAGAAGAIMAGAPVAASGLAAPSVFSVALGAAAVGCTVGFVGATAASGFSVFWERRVAPELVPELRRRLGEDAPPEIRVSDDGGGWSILRNGLQPARDLLQRRSGE